MVKANPILDLKLYFKENSYVAIHDTINMKCPEWANPGRP